MIKTSEEEIEFMLNKIIDHHVHTDFSSDCATDITDLVRQAKHLGLRGLMVTDHVEFSGPEKAPLEVFDYTKYMEKLDELREHNGGLEILMGVEVGYRPDIHETLDAFIEGYPFDFVICSMHECDGYEFYTGEFFNGKSQKQSYLEYFEAVKVSIESYNNYDVYGHLDYIIRYGDFENRVMNYGDYKKVIDDILKLLIQKGKGIEINTSGIRYGLNTMHPNREILSRYIELGGEIITLGSDAHRVQDLQADFQGAVDILRELGAKKIAQFKGRKPYFISID